MLKDRTLLLVPLTLLVWWAFLEVRPVDHGDYLTQFRHFWINKTHTKSTFNFLICGDSRIYRGISPEEIMNEWGDVEAFNFGYSSGSYSTFMMNQMEKRLDWDASTKVMVLGITPYSLTPRAAIDGQMKQELSRKKEEIWEALYLQPWKQLIAPVDIHWSRDTTLQPAQQYLQSFHNDGWVASDKVPPNPNEALADYRTNFKDNSVSATLIDSLMVRIRVWRQKGVAVFAIRPPSTNEMEELENQLSGFNEAEFSRRFEEAGGTWLDLKNPDYKSYDGSHLNEQSARALSRELARRIKGTLGQ